MIILTVDEQKRKDIDILNSKLTYLVETLSRMNKIASSVKEQGIRSELKNVEDRLSNAIGRIREFVRQDAQTQLPITLKGHSGYANNETFVAKQKLDLQVITEMINDL